MPDPVTDPQLIQELLVLQKNEITEHHIYLRIALVTREQKNRDVLLRIAEEELGHYRIWRRHTGQDIKPDQVRILLYYLAARIFGMMFAIRLMEGVEKRAQMADRSRSSLIPEMPQILANEESHERDLIALLDEERLKYVGSIVLGLNDALVEFTGTLAGLTFALQNARIIAVAGLIMGVAASLSMGASEYLSLRSGESPTDPFRASLYTGFAYILTVALLILPFLLFSNPYAALIFTLGGAVAVIFLFTFYISVAKELPFWRRFAEMTAISLGISAISFALGLVIRVFLHVDV
ncbi:MAG: VIT1/CCC1 transporter family protein [Methanoregula sp.]|nr:VIT1/CCC1 transporter family protein [Methanoregula sp.]